MAKSTKALAIEADSNKWTMTMQEIAKAMGVSYDTVNNAVKRIFPNKLQHGKKAFFNESEVACISKELKSNTHSLSHLTVEEFSTVKNTTTELEVLQNYKAATEAMVAMLSAKTEALQAENAKQAQRVQELEHQVEFNEVIDCKRWTDVKKEYCLTKLTKAKVKSYLAERAYWFEKCMGMDKFPTLLIKPEAIDLLVELSKEENNG